MIRRTPSRAYSDGHQRGSQNSSSTMTPGTIMSTMSNFVPGDGSDAIKDELFALCMLKNDPEKAQTRSAKKPDDKIAVLKEIVKDETWMEWKDGGEHKQLYSQSAVDNKEVKIMGLFEGTKFDIAAEWIASSTKNESFPNCTEGWTKDNIVEPFPRASNGEALSYAQTSMEGWIEKVQENKDGFAKKVRDARCIVGPSVDDIQKKKWNRCTNSWSSVTRTNTFRPLLLL